MKKFFIAFVICAFTFSLTAQNVFEYKNQFNIGYFNISNLFGYNNLGIGFKHDCKNGAFRIQTGLHYRQNTSKNNFDSVINTSTNFNLLPRLGYEFHSEFNKFRLFYGCDFIGNYNMLQSSYLDKTESDTTIIKKNQNYSIGLSPFLGICYYFNNTFSISTQTSLDIIYRNYRNINSGSNSSNYELSAALSPLGIFSLNIHFGKK